MLIKHLKIQPSEIDKMEFYRVEYLIDELKEYNEKENRQYEDQNKNTNISRFNPNDFMKGASKFKENVFKGSMPSFGSGFKFPKI